MGKMQYNRNGSIDMVMRRNVIAEMHRGSEDLLPRKRSRHDRHDYTVINASPGSHGSFRQFLHASTGIWVHCGDAVQYRFETDPNDNGAVARVDNIHMSANGVFSPDLSPFLNNTNTGMYARPLEAVTQKWVLESNASVQITIQPIEDDMALSPFPLQPDFDNQGIYFFNCPWMRIVL